MDGEQPWRGLGDFRRAVQERGGKEMHFRRLARAWLGRGQWPAGSGEGLPARLVAALPGIRRALESLAVPTGVRQGTQDGASKLLMELSDGQCVETVLLPRDAVCVSSQVGCAVGCVFCMTGRSGLVRQLGSAEIVAQVAEARRRNPLLRKVDFMGMGEPAHNLRAVLEAVSFLGTYGEFAHKSLMVSSVGDPRLFDALEALPAGSVRPALALSLHCAFDEGRRALLPRAARMPVADIVLRAERYARASGNPVQYEWVLMQGVNDSAAQASELARLLAGRYAMVNLIPVNPVEGSGFVRPGKEQCVAFAEALRASGIVTKIRISAAQDIAGGCGQLRARAAARL